MHPVGSLWFISYLQLISAAPAEIVQPGQPIMDLFLGLLLKPGVVLALPGFGSCPLRSAFLMCPGVDWFGQVDFKKRLICLTTRTHL